MERIMRLKLKGSQLSVSQWAHGRVINIWAQGRNTERLGWPSEFHYLFCRTLMPLLISDTLRKEIMLKNVQYSMKDIAWKNLSKNHIDKELIGVILTMFTLLKVILMLVDMQF